MAQTQARTARIAQAVTDADAAAILRQLRHAAEADYSEREAADLTLNAAQIDWYARAR